MRSVSYLLITLAFAGLSSCVDDDPLKTGNSRLVVVFEPRVAGETYELGQRFTGAGGLPIEVTELKCYLADMYLHSSPADSVLLTAIDLLDFRSGKDRFSFSLPAASYEALSFGLGVPPALNGTQNPNFSVALYDASHPLSENNGMYWAWASGYRFFSLEGRCDTLSSSPQVLPLTMAYHTGRDTLYRHVYLDIAQLPLGADQSGTLKIGIALDSIFTHIDLREERSFHGSSDQMELGSKLAAVSAASFTTLP